MQQLNHEKCVACKADAPRLSESQAYQMHDQIPEWEFVTDNSIRQIQRSFKFPNFSEAMKFGNQVGDLAEMEGHHPRLVTEWGRITITWWTHKIRGLHRNDFIMAAKTDQLYRERT